MLEVVAFLVSTVVYFVAAYYLRMFLEPYGLHKGFNGMVIIGVLASVPSYLVGWLIGLL